MSISLQKGQEVNLSKEKTGLTKVVVGVGWDETKSGKRKDGFVQAIDCDTIAFLLKNGKLRRQEDIVYFGNPQHKSGAVIHQSDNLAGAREGDDEQIIIDLLKVPRGYDKIEVVVNIYDANSRMQHFGMIKNAFIRLVDEKTGEEICRYNLTDEYSGVTAMILGEVYRHNGEWKFNAVGQGTKDTSIKKLVKCFE